MNHLSNIEKLLCNVSKFLVDIGRTEKLCGYSNPLRLRHTFASQKMRTQAGGQRELWTPYFTNTPAEVLNETHPTFLPSS